MLRKVEKVRCEDCNPGKWKAGVVCTIITGNPGHAKTISKLGEFNLLIISVATRPNMKSHPAPGFTNHPIPMSNMVATTHVNEPK